jgi:hypothetical protein
MRPKLWTLTLAGLMAAGLLGTTARDAKAQLVVNTPGFSLGVGAPVVAAGAVGIYPGPVMYPGVGVAPIYPLVRPYPYFYGPRVYGPGVYGRPYGGLYGPRLYRRW